MNYIILDMEWNQAERRTKMVQSPVLLRGEIIQIGAVKTDGDFNYIDKLKLAVCPKYYKVMNRHVEQITGITSLQLTYGERFPQAFKRFRQWCGEEFRIITWGFDDIGILADNLVLHGLDPTFGRDYINLQLIYNSQVDGEKRQCALSGAMERLGIPMEAHAHDAMNDAYFTYEVCRRLDMAKGLADYGRLSADIKQLRRRDVVCHVKDGRNMLEDARVRNTVCPMCERILTPREWLYHGGGGSATSKSGAGCTRCQIGASESEAYSSRPNPQRSARHGAKPYKKTTIADCPEHGSFLVKLSCIRVTDSDWTVSRLIYDADENSIASYERKLEKMIAAREKARHRSKERHDDNNRDV